MSGAVWLSYSLQDLVMFGPEVFLRLFVRINQALWPWLLLWPAAALLLPWLGRQNSEWPRRLAMALAGLAWIGCGYLFLVRYYGPINWPATGFGWVFVVQGLFLLMLKGKALPAPLAWPTVVAWWLVVLVLPWFAVLQAGEMRALALFGVAPGITVAASVLLFAGQPAPLRWLLLLLPLAWSLFSAATYWALGTFWLLAYPGAALVLSVLALRTNPRPARIPDLRSARPGRGHRSSGSPPG
ncbi:hypothetical protein MD273_15690 [Marinobacter pelagius]|uniref:hypothetical protein n=1 Tax=Marinobacter sp. C7 TaxID=2951363 RepID=UPI001EEFE775|nr:hypothetical protein [Marinobacter sp. C7]MCG7201176.1 hypothetical protein [Marinobacter sp. C7]